MAIGVPMPGWVADASAEHPTVATLRAAGAIGIVRYMDPGRNDGTEITAAEIADYHANDFPYALVMEYAADWLEGGYAVGHAGALAALTEEAGLGIPHGVMYLACDFQIMPPQYAQALAAMQGFADAYGGRVYVRPYGSKAFCEWVEAQWGFQGCWSTDAWSNYQTASGSVLHQHATPPPGTPAGCDFNDVLGDWGPRNEDDMTPAQDALLTATAKAVVQLGATLTKFVADEATRANLIVHGDAGHYSLDHLGTDMAAVKAALTKLPGGTVDTQAVAVAVASEVKTITWKAS